MAPSISELSLAGLIGRLKEVEHIKGVKSPDDEQAAILATEVEVKKALFDELQGASTGLASFEKKVAKEFLQVQLKSIDDTTKGAEAKKNKLQELLSGVEGAQSKEDPAHVRRAKQDLTKAEKAFEEATKNYERWEKGKKMFSVDEIKVLKRNYEEGKQKVEKARVLVEEQQQRRAVAAVAPLSEEKERGAAAVATEARIARSSAKASALKVTNPAMSNKATPAVGGYPKQPPPAALRQAQVAAQVRAEAATPVVQVEEVRVAPPRAAPRPRPVQQDAPVLSYACTCTAVAEHMGISEAQARELAESAGEFQRCFDPEVWEVVQERSLAIEKANREKLREAEKRKQQKALAKVTQVQSSVANTAALNVKAPPKAATVAAVKAAVPAPSQAKAKGKAKASEKPIAKLSVANRFGGMESDDEEEGWSTVKR